MPVFKDQSERVALLEECDAIFTVLEFECGISKGAKTSGSDNYSIVLEIETPDGHKGRCSETLTDHRSCDFRLDCFIKSAGIVIPKGAAYEFNRAKAIEKNITWVNPIGLRGWCRVIVDTYIKTDKSEGKSNKIGIFYTDKPKVPRGAVADPGSDEPAGVDPSVGF